MSSAASPVVDRFCIFAHKTAGFPSGGVWVSILSPFFSPAFSGYLTAFLSSKTQLSNTDNQCLKADIEYHIYITVFIPSKRSYLQ